MEDLEKMMYGFGDSVHVSAETAELMEDIVYNFLDQLVTKSYKRAVARGIYNKIIKSDLIFLLRDNPKYLYRIAHILLESKEVNRATQELKEANQQRAD